MRTRTEIKRLVGQLDKKAKEHKRKIDIIRRIKYLIKATPGKTLKTSNNLNEE
ncbi:MAG: hypothetical protein Q8L81_10650 [Bacteroidota bacterium]|nr:hypothetical protein [Bacteroidota bacterium]